MKIQNFIINFVHGQLQTHGHNLFKTMTINNIQDEIIEEFEGIDDWMDRYAYIIELGTALEPLPESEKTNQNLIEGCQSRVWITAELDEEGRIIFRADSDADLYFINRIGLSEHLSPTRSNGLLAMVRQMRNYATAFQALRDAKKSN